MCCDLIPHKTFSRDIILDTVISHIEVWKCWLLVHCGANKSSLKPSNFLYLLLFVVEVHLFDGKFLGQQLAASPLDPELDILSSSGESRVPVHVHGRDFYLREGASGELLLIRDTQELEHGVSFEIPRVDIGFGTLEESSTTQYFIILTVSSVPSEYVPAFLIRGL